MVSQSSYNEITKDLNAMFAFPPFLARRLRPDFGADGDRRCPLLDRTSGKPYFPGAHLALLRPDC